MSHFVGNSFLFKVLENLLNDRRVFYAGDDFNRTFALLADLVIDVT